MTLYKEDHSSKRKILNKSNDSWDDAATAFGPSTPPVMLFVAFQIEKLFFINRSSSVSSDQGYSLDWIHVREFNESNRYHLWCSTQACNAMNSNAIAAFVWRARIEYLLHYLKPLIDNIRRRRMSISIFHFMKSNSSRLEFCSMIGRLAYPNHISYRVLSHFFNV